jgi:hypothetical protein
VSTVEGDNMWLKEEDIVKLHPVFPDFHFTFDIIKQEKNIGFIERFWRLEHF